MGIITLIYLSGAVTGTVVGEVYNPLGLPVNDSNVVKECSTKRITNKTYNMEIKDYIQTESVEELCNSITNPDLDTKPIRDALRKSLWKAQDKH